MCSECGKTICPCKNGLLCPTARSFFKVCKFQFSTSERKKHIKHIFLLLFRENKYSGNQILTKCLLHVQPKFLFPVEITKIFLIYKHQFFLMYYHKVVESLKNENIICGFLFHFHQLSLHYYRWELNTAVVSTCKLFYR